MSDLKHIVGFSGGIDSQALARWVLNRYPAEDVFLLNSDAGGNEHWMTTEFVNWYSGSVHPVISLNPVVGDMGRSATKEGTGGAERRREFADSDPLTFDTLAYIKGRFPSRTMQFCTEFLKLRPANRWIRENIIDKGLTFRRYSGVRWDESGVRAKKKAIEWDDYLGGELHHPIIDFTKKMCFDYVAYHREKINELYTLGFDRVGCAPCVNSTKDDILAWFQRFPEMIDKVRAWEKRVGKTFFAPVVPGMELNWIDDVVRWSKTVRGGKQFSLLVIPDRPACESAYGLCE